MRILFYHPTAYSRFAEPVLGLGYLMAVAKNLGHDVTYYDHDLHSRKIEARTMVLDSQPDVIAVGCMTTQFYEAKKALRSFKELAPSAVAIVGGVHVSALPHASLPEMPEADYLCVGEGEKTFAEFLDYLGGMSRGQVDAIHGLAFRRNGSVVLNEQRALMDEAELDRLPMVAWDELTKHGMYEQPLHYEPRIAPVFSIMTARGCPFRCTFCDEGTIWKRKVRRRSIDHVVQEIGYLVSRYGAKYFNILDDTFTLSPTRVEEFCEKVGPLGISFRITAKVTTVNKEMLDSLKDAGCRLVAYGVESGNQRVLDRMKKRQTVEQIKAAFALTRRAGITSNALCMVGNIGEDMEAVQETGRLVEEINADLFSVAVMTPYPGSENYRVCEQNGWLLHRDWEKWCPTPVGIREWEPVARTDKMDRDSMLKAYYLLNKRFVAAKYRNKYGGLFYLRPSFFKGEVRPRIRSIGIGSVLRHAGRLGRA